MSDEDKDTILRPTNLMCSFFGHKLRKHEWYHRRDDLMGWSRLCQCVRCIYSTVETVRQRDRPPDDRKLSWRSLTKKLES